MSIVCGAIKNGEVAIACDTQSNFGSLKVSSKHMANHSKLFSVNDSIIGIVGWHAVIIVIEHLIRHEKELFRLSNRIEIFDTLLKLHDKMKTAYFIETSEDDDQPVQSNQLDGLIINKNGLFQIGSYREVNQFKTYWAMGSGKRLALGAMHALYKNRFTAKQIVEAGVMAACEYDDGCSGPTKSRVLKLR